MRWTVLLALVGLAAGRALIADPSNAPPPGGSSDSRAIIERCAREADAELRGLNALSHSCPELEAAVHRLGLDPFLPPDWQKTTSARALSDLAALADRYAAPPPALRLDGARLKVIAHSLEPPPAPPNPWERVKAWLRNWLEPKSEGTSNWLRFLPHWHISAELARLILETLVALIVIGVVALVVNELKASGLMGGSGYRRSGRDGSPGARPTGDASLDFDAFDSAAARERPMLLLRLLVHALTRSRRLRHDRDLTCRELIAKARFDSPRQREQFGKIALLAERARYGDPALAPAIAEEMLTEARALHAELLSAPRIEQGMPEPATS